MAFVIKLPDGNQTRPVYADRDAVVAGLQRRSEVGATAWWCKYGRNTKMLIATRTATGIEMFDGARGEAARIAAEFANPAGEIVTHSPYEMSVADVREIAAASGIDHAEFCVGQTASHLGEEYAEPLRAAIDALRQQEWAALAAATDGSSKGI